MQDYDSHGNEGHCSNSGHVFQHVHAISMPRSSEDFLCTQDNSCHVGTTPLEGAHEESREPRVLAADPAQKDQAEKGGFRVHEPSQDEGACSNSLETPGVTASSASLRNSQQIAGVITSQSCAPLMGQASSFVAELATLTRDLDATAASLTWGSMLPPRQTAKGLSRSLCDEDAPGAISVEQIAANEFEGDAHSGFDWSPSRSPPQAMPLRARAETEVPSVSDIAAESEAETPRAIVNISDPCAGSPGVKSLIQYWSNTTESSLSTAEQVVTSEDASEGPADPNTGQLDACYDLPMVHRKYELETTRGEVSCPCTPVSASQPPMRPDVPMVNKEAGAISKDLQPGIASAGTNLDHNGAWEQTGSVRRSKKHDLESLYDGLGS